MIDDKIKEILSEAAEATNDGNQYITVLAALPLWNDVDERWNRYIEIL